MIHPPSTITSTITFSYKTLAASVGCAGFRGAPGVLEAGCTKGKGGLTFVDEAELAGLAVRILNALHTAVVLVVADTAAVAIFSSCASLGLSSLSTATYNVKI